MGCAVGQRVKKLWAFARCDVMRPALPAAQPPWVLYGTLLLIVGVGAWEMMDLAATPQPARPLSFQLAASRDDLASLRQAWIECVVGKGIGAAECADLDGALAIANRQRYQDIIEQLQRWGVTGRESCSSVDAHAAQYKLQPTSKP